MAIYNSLVLIEVLIAKSTETPRVGFCMVDRMLDGIEDAVKPTHALPWRVCNSLGSGTADLNAWLI